MFKVKIDCSIYGKTSTGNGIKRLYIMLVVLWIGFAKIGLARVRVWIRTCE